MTDKIELKPCPFCGGDAQMEPVKLHSGTWYGVVCRNTGNLGGTCAIEQVPSRTPEAAAGRWNMRQIMINESDHQQSQLDQLKTDNERLARNRDMWKGQVERQAEELARLRKALTECADSLHAEMLQKFGGQLPDDMHPVTRREYDRDMVEVAGYQVATAKADDDIPDFTPGNGNKARRRAEALGVDYDAALDKGDQP